MKRKRLCLAIVFAALSGCAAPAQPVAPSAAPSATPAPTPLPPPTLFAAASSIPPTPINPIEGTTTTQVNVRAQPSKESPALGMLESSARVPIIGKDESGAWYEILYADSFGWVSASYVQTNRAAEIPLSASRLPTPQPTRAAPTAPQDGDSLSAPLAAAVLAPSAARALQVDDFLSAADAEDWIQFQAPSGTVSVKIECAEGVLNVELWNRGAPADSFSLPCGGEKRLAAENAEMYALRVFASFSNELHYIRYALFLKSVQ